MTQSYQDFINRKSVQYGDKFDPSDLAPKFIPYFESGERIKIDCVGLDDEGRDVYGHYIITGTIGVTTGSRPVFLLMARSNSSGSGNTISGRDRIIAVKRGRAYRAVR